MVQSGSSRFTLVVPVENLGYLSGLAKTRGRLLGSMAITSLAALAYGWWCAWYVLGRGANPILNIGLISLQFFFIFGAAYVQAMWVASLVFGDAWRRRTFLGERPSIEDDDFSSLGGNSLQFYGIFALAVVVSYFGIKLATGDYIQRYNLEGYTATLLRSPDPETRVQAIRSLADPMNRVIAARQPVRELVIKTLEDPDAELQAWAAWVSGEILLEEAAEELSRLLETAPLEVRIEAALALGRLRDPAGERQMVRLLGSDSLDPALEEALILGLGLIPSNRAIPLLLERLGREDNIETAALWAVSSTRRTEGREEVLAAWEGATGERRCVLAEAMKHLTVLDDDGRLRRSFVAMESEPCEERLWLGRQYEEGKKRPLAVLVVGESLRLKILKAVFNIGGPNLREWLVDVAWDTEFEAPLRIEADRLAELLRTLPSRPPRRQDFQPAGESPP